MKNDSISTQYIEAQTHGLPLCSQVLPAQVITRWSEGCHIRVAEKHDAILPADALPSDTDRFGIRILRDGVVLHVAA